MTEEELFEKATFTAAFIVENDNENRVEKPTETDEEIHPDFEKALRIKMSLQVGRLDEHEIPEKTIDQLYQKHRKLHPSPEEVEKRVGEEIRE